MGIIGKKKLLFVTFLIGLTISHAFAEKILIGVSFSIPPYVIQDSNQGIELEILQEAFKIKGHTVEIEYLPLSRTFLHLRNAELDGIINIKEGMIDYVYYSDIVITFQNCAISLLKKGYSDFEGFEFLKDKYLIAFQRAGVILGSEFSAISKNNIKYEETADQKIQLFRLFLERNADFIIIEEKIFKYYRMQLSDEIGAIINFPVKFHYIFPPTNYKFAFSSKEIRDDFIFGLNEIKINGVYDRIFAKYDQIMRLNLDN